MTMKSVIGVMGIGLLSMGCHMATVEQPFTPNVIRGYDKDETALSALKRSDYSIDRETSGKSCGNIRFGAQTQNAATVKNADKTFLASDRIVYLRTGQTLANASLMELPSPMYQSESNESIERYRNFVFRALGLDTAFGMSSSDTEDKPQDMRQLGLVENAAVHEALSKLDKHTFLVDPRFTAEKETIFGWGTVCVTVKARVLTLGEGPVAGGPRR